MVTACQDNSLETLVTNVRADVGHYHMFTFTSVLQSNSIRWVFGIATLRMCVLLRAM